MTDFCASVFHIHRKKIGKKSVLVLATLVWIVVLLLGIIPSILSGSVTFKFYDNSHVCIGLPLALTKKYTTKTIQKEHNPIWDRFYTDTYITQQSGLVNGLYFSTTIFLGLNCVCYLIILGCYVELVRAVRKSAKKSGRTPDMKEQIKLTTKVTAIVATDFFCWFPIIVLGILVQTRVIELPSSVYAWCVTVVLPINSAINPYLYTISELISACKKKHYPQNKHTQSSSLQSSKLCKTLSDKVQTTQATTESSNFDNADPQGQEGTWF